MEKRYSTEIKALNIKDETHEKIVSILEEIKPVWNGNYSEIDIDRTNMLQIVIKVRKPFKIKIIAKPMMISFINPF